MSVGILFGHTGAEGQGKKKVPDFQWVKARLVAEHPRVHEQH